MSFLPSDAEKNAAKFPAAKSVGEQILTNAQDSRPVVQDFVSLAQSLEWELGQQYLKDRGNKAFISDASPVPFVINNDGNLSRNAADVLFANLEAEAREHASRSAHPSPPAPLPQGARGDQECSVSREDEIYVLELGIGVGLFARFFLDHFQELCEMHRKDYYERLVYIAADRSVQMLRDVIRHGVLANHPGRYRLRVVDAMNPAGVWEEESEEARGVERGTSESPHPGPPPQGGREKDGGTRGGGGRRIRAVFLNYLLDCLPAAVLQFEGNEVKELHVRTCVGRNVKLEHFTDLTLEQLKERAGSSDPRAKEELLEVYGLFQSEYDYRPVDAGKIPYGTFGVEYARPMTKRFLLSWGAIQSLERLLGLVADDGFILINDYGQTMMSREEEFEHQRFSLATFVGVNFPLLKAYFEKSEVRSQRSEVGDQKSEVCWIEPQTEAGGIHARLLCRRRVDEVVVKFWERFSETAHKHLHEPIELARNCAKVGRFELAASYFSQALERQPRNWVLLNEISMFLIFTLRDVKAGIEMAKSALALNPTCSAELWNTLGDGLFEHGRIEEARSAYTKALTVNESDVRARFNLAWCHEREMNYPAALEILAKALALDKTGSYRERIMRKLTDVASQLSLRHQAEYLLLINLVSKYAKKDEK